MTIKSSFFIVDEGGPSYNNNIKSSSAWDSSIADEGYNKPLTAPNPKQIIERTAAGDDYDVDKIKEREKEKVGSRGRELRRGEEQPACRHHRRRRHISSPIVFCRGCMKVCVFGVRRTSTAHLILYKIPCLFVPPQKHNPHPDDFIAFYTWLSGFPLVYSPHIRSSNVGPFPSHRCRSSHFQPHHNTVANRKFANRK